METELLTSKQDFDGVVVDGKQVHALPADNFNITSTYLDILRIQICKSQVTQELSNDCLSILQKNINSEIKSGNYFTFGVIGISLLTILSVIYIIRKGMK